MAEHFEPGDGNNPGDIAIVGMAGRFPGARNVAAYWNLVKSGRPGIVRRSTDELHASGVRPELASHPDYVPVAGMIEDVESFDAAFFDIGPRDAALMDPQHRHFLECCWEALEDAGHPPTRFAGSIGVYAGSGMNGYLIHNLLTNPEMTDSLGMFVVRHTSNDKDFLSTGVSYKLNLRGPSVNVQTACSTSLVAIHLAAQSLLANECDMALAGGVTIEVPHGAGYLYREGEILSRDGVCRAFDSQSSGTVLTSGAGVVALRRLDDAIRDRDSIHAVIKATAINNDGSGKVGYLAPSVEGHANVVIEAQELADVEPETIQYVETHGTGTPVGDPIEIAALTQAFQRASRSTGYARLGSAKPTVGHLDTAAGVASVIKTALALEHQQLPPMAGHTTANSVLDLESTPFVLSGELTPWVAGHTPRRAGVSSLGVGGTNAHAVLEEGPPFTPTIDSGDRRLVVLSAKTTAALERAHIQLADHLDGSNSAFADVAWTLQEGRAEFPYRFAAVASDRTEAAAKLRESIQPPQTTSSSEPSVAFMFPGGGAQYPNMGRGLYETLPVYRDAVDTCLDLLGPALGSAVKEVLFPAAGFEESAAEQFAMPSIQLPAIFLTEYALAQLWQSWGVRPAAMTGHSLGEYTAACLAGVFSLRDALAVVSLRGRIMERVPDAAMISINLPEPEVTSMLQRGLSLAAVNAPQLCVVSGERGPIEQLEGRLGSNDVANRRLKIVGAVHCHLLDPFLEEFSNFVSTLQLSTPTVPYISNVTGDWIRPAEACDPAYWVRHLRETVRFSDGLETLLADPNRVLIEVGPGTTLTTLARQRDTRPVAVVPSLPHAREAISDAAFTLQALGDLWKAGVAVDWKRQWGAVQPRRISLPTYPFERERHWISPGNGGKSRNTASAERRPIADWFSTSSWQRTPLLPSPEFVGQQWLVFVDDAGLGAAVVEQLRAADEDVVVATIGGPESPFIKLSKLDYVLNPSAPESFDQLFEQLSVDGLMPSQMIHVGGVPDPKKSAWPRMDSFALNMDRGYFGLFELLKAFGRCGLDQPVHLTCVTAGAFSVAIGDPVTPELAMVPVLAAVAARENPKLTWSSLDVPAFPAKRRFRKKSAAWSLADAVSQVLGQALSAASETVALREGERWVQSSVKVAVPARPAASDLGLRQDGCYLVTGASGAIGMELARFLAGECRPRLALLSRRNPELSEGLVDELRQAGAEVLLLRADVADRDALKSAVAEARSRFGTIHGLFHAAGTLNDSPLVLKEREQIEEVLRSKVRGLLNLESVLDFGALDFAVLFSSVSARLAPAGQADYAPANAFVSAFAEHRTQVGDKRTVAVEWSMWKGRGMGEAGRVAAQVADAPCCPPGRLVHETEVETWREFTLTPGQNWMIDEHRTASGARVLPGSAHVELLRQAAAASGFHVAELRNVEFLRPLVVRHPTLVQLRAAKRSAGLEVGVWSLSPSGSWIEHSRARALPSTSEPEDVPEARFDSDLETPEGSTVAQAGLDFGPRWHCLRQQGFDTSEGWAALSLAGEHSGDLDQFALHPAMFDMATSFALPLVSGFGAGTYVPVQYEAIRIHGPLGPNVISRTRLRSSSASGEVASFDVFISTPEGKALVACDGVTFRRVADLEGLETEPAPDPRPKGRLVSLGERMGIEPGEGMQALKLVLGRSGTPTLAVSPLSLGVLEEAVEADARADQGGPLVERPQLRTGFEAPRDPIETALAQIWTEMLGVNSVGVNDDFFELGGHSLVALRMFARIKERFGFDLGLAALFDTPTVAGLAAVLRGDSQSAFATAATVEGGKAWPCLVPIKASGTLPPLYCVHGAKGNVLNFRNLGQLLPAEQPLYGLQLQGLNGVDAFHTSIEEMAAQYVAEILGHQPVGPYYLGGFSGGGLVALEMARQLKESGAEVALVLLFDAPAPDYHKMRSFPWFQLRNVESVIQYGPCYLTDRIRGRWYWWNWGKGRPSGIDFNHFGSVLAGHQAHLYDGYTVLLRVKTRVYPADLGWNKWITRGIESHTVEGAHEAMWQPPHVRRLAELVTGALSRARDSVSRSGSAL